MIPVRWPIAIAALALVVGASIAVLIELRRQPEPAVRPHATIARATPPRPAEPKPPIAKKPVDAPPSAFALEQAMSPRQLITRWQPLILEASKRFGVPQSWIRAVMQTESGGRTTLEEGVPITSSMGAMGLMQLMPETYEDMRRGYDLGADPYDPHDNIMAGAAYLRFLRGKYGYPQMFSAYNDGPGNLDARLKSNGLLPAETQLYLVNVVSRIETGHASNGDLSVKLTRPDGTPITFDAGAVTAVRASLAGEYAPGVRTVIAIGRKRQGVREDLATVRSAIRARGGAL